VWRKLHNEELNDLYSSPNIIQVSTSRRISWSGHVARMVKRRGAYRSVVGQVERDHLEDIGVDRRIILKCVFKKWDGTQGLDSFGSG
jgi:hypothetical protein